MKMLQNNFSEFAFDTNEQYQLEDDRILLRPLTADDYSHLLPFALQEPGLWTYGSTTAAGEEGLKAYIAQTLQARKDGKEYPFIVYDKAAGNYAGSTRFYDINLPFKTLQLGYTWYGSAFHGTGLNKHCKFLLLDFAFSKAGMERIEFRADANNARSIAAMKSIGCTVEGTLRSHMPKRDGGRRNTIVLSILREEWYDQARQALFQKL